MIPLKSLSPDAIPRALAKAERYRLINQPWAAESICLDILAIAPAHQEALKTLLLARTDQFRGDAMGHAVERAREALGQLDGPYERAYYGGMISERRAMAKVEQGGPGAGFIAHDLLREAMTQYEAAAAIRPAGDDDALLRWNTCARLLNESPLITERVADPQDTTPVMNE